MLTQTPCSIVRRFQPASILALAFALCLDAHAAPKGLDIYFIDVEGGAATLIVTPQGESLLVDSGWKRDDLRDAKRIHDTAKRLAGLKQIDHYVTCVGGTRFGNQIIDVFPEGDMSLSPGLPLWRLPWVRGTIYTPTPTGLCP